MTDPRQLRFAKARTVYERRLKEYEEALGPHERWDPADYERISRQLLIESGLADATTELLQHRPEQDV